MAIGTERQFHDAQERYDNRQEYFEDETEESEVEE